MNLLTNPSSLRAQQSLAGANSALGVAIARLSSGLRINSAADDAAGLAIANRMTTQVNGAKVATRNAQDAGSMMQVAQGALDSINANLQRIRELAVQAGSGIHGKQDLASLQEEVDARLLEIDRISADAEYNGINLFAGQSITYQVGMGTHESDTLRLVMPQGLDQISLGLSEPDHHFLIAPSQKYNPLPLSEPITDITIGGVTYPLAFAGRTIPGEPPWDAEKTAKYYGAKVQDITFHKAIDPITGNTFKGLYVCKIGDTMLLEVPYFGGGGFELNPVTGAAEFTLTHTDKTYIDPDNGINSPVLVKQVDPYSIAKLGITPDGHIIDYYDFMGMQFDRSDPYFIVSGPNKNNIEVQFEMPATQDAIDRIDQAIAKVDAYRSMLGATQNRLDSIVSSLSSTNTNLQAARSRIQDADYAIEVSNMTRAQIISQAAQSALTQANQMSEGILRLLGR